MHTSWRVILWMFLLVLVDYSRIMVSFMHNDLANKCYFQVFYGLFMVF
jgi:hypothetical protein